MSKTPTINYTFNAAAKTVTLNGLAAVNLERLALITNVTRGVVIYQFNSSTLGATAAGNVVTLAYNTASMSNSDVLRIDYDDGINQVQQ